VEILIGQEEALVTHVKSAKPGGAAPLILGSVPKPPVIQDGDWSCPSCGNINWARRNACNKCGTPKNNSGNAGGPGGGNSSYGAQRREDRSGDRREKPY